MSFAITFTKEPNEFPYDDPKVPAAAGRLELGNYHEGFTSTLAEWDRHAYHSQWAHALQSFVNGADRAALITEYLSPARSRKLELWALYRGEHGLVHVQNHLLFYDQLDRKFSVAEASGFLNDRKVFDEDGNSISEWNVTFRDVEYFFYHFDRLCNGTRKGDWDRSDGST